MKTRLARSMVPLALAALICGGCVDDQEMFFVASAVGVDPESCNADPSVALLTDVIDTSVGGTFGVFLQLSNVQNQNPQSNTNLDDDGELALKYAEVSFTAIGGAPVGDAFEVPVAGNSIPSGGGLTTFVPIPASAISSTGEETVIIGIVIVADRTDQAGKGSLGEVRSRQYTFPVSVCSNCLPCTMPACGLASASACPEEEATDDTTTDTTGGP